MLLCLIVRCENETNESKYDDTKYLPEITGVQLKRLKEQNNTFLAIFGRHRDCEACSGAARGMRDKIAEEGDLMEAYFIDCEDNDTTTYIACYQQYKPKELPTFILFNHNQIKRTPLLYPSKNFSYARIHEWVLNNTRVSYKTILDENELLEVVNMSKFLLILTEDDQIDGLMKAQKYFIKEQSFTMFGLTQTVYDKLVQTKIGSVLRQDVVNFIFCDASECQRFEGDLREVEAVQELVKNFWG